MPIKVVSVQFSAPIHDKVRREQIISGGLTRVAKRYVKQQKDRMDHGPHTGRQYKRPGIPGAGRVHQASRFGERPAPDTLRLKGAVAEQKVSPSTHEAFVEGSRAPHGDYLTRPRLGRAIMTDADAAEAEAGIMRDEMERAGRMLAGGAG